MLAYSLACLNLHHLIDCISHARLSHFLRETMTIVGDKRSLFIQVKHIKRTYISILAQNR